jgi:hypothetical protein
VSGFHLDKWYIDGVDAESRTIIGYWAALSWGALSLSWQSLVAYPHAQPAQRRWTALRGRAPHQQHGELSWDALGGRATVHVVPAAPAIHARLWDAGSDAGSSSDADRSAGTVDWLCVAPVGAVSAKVRGLPDFTGIGYAERLSMSVPPWRLPIGQLRWGRWCDVAGEHSLVWIDWAGPPARRWVHLDGRRVEAHVGDGEVRGDGFTLTLSDPVLLEDRAFAEVARHVPGLMQLLPSSMREMRETKWLSHGRLQLDRERAMTGTCVHELVIMP